MPINQFPSVSGGGGVTYTFSSPLSESSGTVTLPASTTRSHLNVEDGADVTDATNVESAGALMESSWIKSVILKVDGEQSTGDNKISFSCPSTLNNHNLTSCYARLGTAGTTGTQDIQIHNVDNALDMLSTVMTIDSTEIDTSTASTPAVINTSNDHVNTNDVIRVDIDAVHTTPGQDLEIVLEFTPQ